MSKDDISREEFLEELAKEIVSIKGAVLVKGYIRKDGTEVRPHIRTVKREKQ